MTEAIPEAELLADAVAAPTEAALSTVSSLAQDLIDLEADVTQAELLLKSCKEKHRRVAEDLLPAALQEHGLSEIRMSNGIRIVVRQVITANIVASWADDRRQKGFDWLEANGLGDIIKHHIEVDFGRGEEEAASSAVTELEKLGAQPTNKLHVSHQTLAAVVRDRISRGLDVADETLGVFRINVAEVK